MNQIKKYLSDFKSGTKTMFKEFFNKETNKKQRANMWTFSRLIVSLIIPILTIISSITNSIALLGIALGTTAFGALTDFFDGRSARKHNSTSEFGKNLDIIADKAFATSLGLSLSIFNPLFLLNIAGELAIAITNVTYKVKHPDLNIDSSKIGKIKQWPLSATVILGMLSLIIPSLSLVTNIAIISTIILQLATFTNYIQTNNKQIKDTKQLLKEHNEEIEEIKTETIVKEKEVIKASTATKKKEELIKLRNELNKILKYTETKEEHKIRKREKK